MQNINKVLAGILVSSLGFAVLAPTADAGTPSPGYGSGIDFDYDTNLDAGASGFGEASNWGPGMNMTGSESSGNTSTIFGKGKVKTFESEGKQSPGRKSKIRGAGIFNSVEAGNESQASSVGPYAGYKNWGYYPGSSSSSFSESDVGVGIDLSIDN